MSAAQSSAARALLVRVRDVPALVRAQGGAAGGFAAQLAPQTMENLVYGKMKDEFAEKLKEKGVDADVQVVASAGFVPAGSSPIWKPLAFGLGAGLLYMVLFRKRGAGR